MIEVHGELLHHAYACRHGLNDTVIVLTVDNGIGLPFELRYLVGSTPQAHIDAPNIAAGMLRGHVVRAGAAYVQSRSDHGPAVLALRQLQSLVVNGTTYK